VQDDGHRRGERRQSEYGVEEADHPSRERVYRYSLRQSASGWSVAIGW
jgi:hypothetical protein